MASCKRHRVSSQTSRIPFLVPFLPAMGLEQVVLPVLCAYSFSTLPSFPGKMDSYRV